MLGVVRVQAKDIEVRKSMPNELPPPEWQKLERSNGQAALFYSVLLVEGTCAPPADKRRSAVQPRTGCTNRMTSYAVREECPCSLFGSSCACRKSLSSRMPQAC